MIANTIGESPTADANAQIVQTALDAFSSGNIDGFVATLHPDVTWHEPGNNPLSGDYTGVEAVLGFVGKLVEATEGTLKIDEVHDVLGDDDHAVALARLSASKGGVVYILQESSTYHFKDNRISEISIFY